MTKQALLDLIDEKVYQNENNEITGAGLNEVLKAMVNNIGNFDPDQGSTSDILIAQ